MLNSCCRASLLNFFEGIERKGVFKYRGTVQPTADGSLKKKQPRHSKNQT
jgi:hypothetical protein